MELLWEGGTKFVQMVLVTWPRWLPCPYMVKTLKNLLRNQKADDLETWYAASGARVLPSLFKWWPWVDLDLHFTARSNLVPYAFVGGKKVKQWIFQKLLSSDLKLATDDQSDKKFLLTSKLCPLGAVFPLPRGYIHVLHHEKKMYKIRLQEISLK